MTLLTVKDVAGMRKLSERTIYAFVQDGSIPYVKIGGAVPLSF